MSRKYGYCRISTGKQNIERQERNLRAVFPDAVIIKEIYTDTKFQGRSWIRYQKAVLETIQICKNRNVLKEYLSSKEKEVVDIMMVLYNKQEVMKSYIESERHDEKVETAKHMLENGTLTRDKIA